VVVGILLVVYIHCLRLWLAHFFDMLGADRAGVLNRGNLPTGGKFYLSWGTFNDAEVTLLCFFL